MISTIVLCNEEGKFVENLRVFMNGKDGYKLTLEAATRSDILYLFGQGNLIFIREKFGNFEKRCLWQPCIRRPSLVGR